MHEEITQQTPLMQQYATIKKEYADMLLFFQVGDFYELFFDDAKTAAHFLGIALTKRGKTAGTDIPLCGVPIHAFDHYVSKLVKGGFKVAVCNQLEQPKPGTVVRRGVVRVFTPGTLVEQHLLDEKSSSYIVVLRCVADGFGFLAVEFLTGQLFFTFINDAAIHRLEAELLRFFPDEIILISADKLQFVELFKKINFVNACIIDVIIQDDQCEDFLGWIAAQFHQSTVDLIEKHVSIHQTLLLFYAYLKKSHEQALVSFSSLHRYTATDFLNIDTITQKNLELFVNLYDGSRNHTLLQLLDKAVTPMGSRMIKKWLTRPLIDAKMINQRLDVIELCFKDPLFAEKITDILKKIGDAERAIGRILLAKAVLADFFLLRDFLTALDSIKQLLQPVSESFALLSSINQSLVQLPEMQQLLADGLDEATLSTGYIIRPGFDQPLDQLRELMVNGNQKIVELEKQEQEKTGIGSLKIRFNTLYGYYIEMSKTAAVHVPEDYKPLQSLVGKERYTCTQLDLLARQIERAKADFYDRERLLFEDIKSRTCMFGPQLRKTCHGIAHLDAILGLAACAQQRQYVRPLFTQEKKIAIKGGRHPIVEASTNVPFIQNDTLLDQAQTLFILTGPNMGGKSTYLRQTALITIMAHLGSFVPAASVELMVCDGVYTRIGSGDFISGGKSTFLVEMEETAKICQYATDRSLVILDEVGRGTSTVDGRSIAQAVIEYLEKKPVLTLFATHYHELTALTLTHSGIKAFFMACKKHANGITFLYQLTPGVADGSFGIEVAKLAQLPEKVLERAVMLCQQALSEEKRFVDGPIQFLAVNEVNTVCQHELLINQVRALNVEDITPRQALDIIVELQKNLQ
ncbi:DNA mismatch repair protein MutS [bacterium]|nr:MAG: DNA mismatch repair protein MutS [bacterium]